MKLEALRWDIQNIPSNEKLRYLTNIGNHFEKLLEKDENLTGDWQNQVRAIANVAKDAIKTKDTILIDIGLERTEGLLWGLENANAVNLQRAVDTPKSARKVDEQTFNLCESVSKFKKVEWIKDKDNELAYLKNQGIAANTNDPIGLIVQLGQPHTFLNKAGCIS